MEIDIQVQEILNSTNEMSRSKAWVEDKIREQSEEFVDHAIKCMLWNKSKYVNHWSNELYNFAKVAMLYTLKGTNKLPTFDQIYAWLITDTITKDTLQQRIHIISTGYLTDQSLDEPRNLQSENITNFWCFIEDVVRFLSLGQFELQDMKDLVNQYLVV